MSDPGAPAELWTAAQAARADAHTMDTLGTPSPVLMERASLAVADQVMARLASGDAGRAADVCVLAGPGNNGGDGLAVARILAGRGVSVFVHLVTARRNAAAQAQLELARAHGVHVHQGVPDDAREPAWVVDAMLGTGATGAPRDAIADAVAWCQGRRVVAVDLPTGVDADDGTCPGAAVRARCTVTFERSKPGLHLTPGRDHAGEVVVARIGLVAPADLEPRAWLIDPAGAAIEIAQDESSVRHKGDRGHVGLLAGGAATPGAAMLAGVGALRGGAGLVTVRLADATARAALVARRPELMTEVADAPAAGTAPLARADALVVGPGLTDRSHGVDLTALWSSDPRPAVWDASALDEIAGPPGPAAGLRVITPHPGEAARLLQRLDASTDADDEPWSSARVQRTRLVSARRLAVLTGALTVLKGAGTVLAATDGRAWVCTAGGPELSSAGTGDVLAGLLGARLAGPAARRGDGRLEAARVVGVAVLAHAAAGRIAVDRRPRPAALDVAAAVDHALHRLSTDRGAAWRAALGYPGSAWR